MMNAHKKLFAIIALAAGAIVGSVMYSSPVEASAHSADTTQYTSNWSCFTPEGQYQGSVSIWWGHTEGDAKWACNNWISACGNHHSGGCWATQS